MTRYLNQILVEGIVGDQGHVSRLLNVFRDVFLWVLFPFSIVGLV